jgi:hypothetical protein
LTFLATASDAAAGDAAKTGKTILAVVAAGENPAGFAGRDLVARLGALYHPASGAYGDGSTFSQAFAILAIVASHGSVSAAATAELAALQGFDGSWSYGAARPKAGEGDTNSTAIALMALEAAGVYSADAAGLDFLSSQQLPDGGFPYQNSTAFGPPASDADSDSMVLQALVATGEDPASAAWSVGANNVLTSLRGSQGGDGGFAYPGMGESAFTTSQVPAALLRFPYAAAAHPKYGLAVPAAKCPGAVASVAAVASPSPSAGASASGVPANGNSNDSSGHSGDLRAPLALAILAGLCLVMAVKWRRIVRALLRR